MINYPKGGIAYFFHVQGTLIMKNNNYVIVLLILINMFNVCCINAMERTSTNPEPQPVCFPELATFPPISLELSDRPRSIHFDKRHSAQNSINPSIPVPTMTEMLERLDLNYEDLCCGWQCLACEHLKQQNTTNDIKSIACLSCQKIDEFIHSNFSWLFNKAKLGYMPSINVGFMQYFGGRMQLNIGAIFSFSPYQNNSTVNSKINQLQSTMREKIAARNTKIAEWETKFAQANSGLLNANALETIKLELNTIINKINILHNEIVQIYHTIAASNEALTNKLFCNNINLPYHHIRLSLPSNAEPKIIKLYAEEIQRFIVRTQDVIIQTNKNIIIVDDVSMDKTVTLFTCWLIAQGWSLDNALKQARARRLEHRELLPHYQALISAYINLQQETEQHV